jgi:hypothetical protein
MKRLRGRTCSARVRSVRAGAICSSDARAREYQIPVPAASRTEDAPSCAPILEALSDPSSWSTRATAARLRHRIPSVRRRAPMTSARRWRAAGPPPIGQLLQHDPAERCERSSDSPGIRRHRQLPPREPYALGPTRAGPCASSAGATSSRRLRLPASSRTSTAATLEARCAGLRVPGIGTTSSPW